MSQAGQVAMTVDPRVVLCFARVLGDPSHPPDHVEIEFGPSFSGIGGSLWGQK
jgi:hypothetical protein